MPKIELVELIIECAKCKHLNMFSVTKEHLEAIEKSVCAIDNSIFSPEEQAVIRGRNAIFPLCAKCRVNDAIENEFG